MAISKVTYYKANGQTQAEKLVRAIRGDGVNRRNVSALAREIGEPRETVSGWLRCAHRMPLYGAIALAAAVGMSVEELATYFR